MTGCSFVCYYVMLLHYAYQRNELVNQSPTTEDIKARCPALFETSNVNYKCMVIRTISLQLYGASYLNTFYRLHHLSFRSKMSAPGIQVHVQAG